MGLMATDTGGGDFEITEEGVHIAVCYGVIDLGTQHNRKWDSWQRKIMIMWELPNLRIDITNDDGTVNKPRAISRRFTLSLSEKSLLRPFLESWRGKKFNFQELAGFNLEKLIGVSCQLQVLHNEFEGKTYANVHTVMPMTKGVEPIMPENPTVFYSMDDDGLKYPPGIPEWISKVIMDSREYNETGQQNDWPDDNPADYREPEDEQIPF